MSNVREAWTDARLDDFGRNVDHRFDRLEKKVDGLSRRMDDGFRDIRTEMNAKFERVEGRLDDINRTMLRLGGGALVTFAVGFAGLIATQL
jgi:tetrahydromethanopterin S-methyltransferase subunit G